MCTKESRNQICTNNFTDEKALTDVEKFETKDIYWETCDPILKVQHFYAIRQDLTRHALTLKHITFFSAMQFSHQNEPVSKERSRELWIPSPPKASSIVLQYPLSHNRYEEQYTSFSCLTFSILWRKRFHTCVYTILYQKSINGFCTC